MSVATALFNWGWPRDPSAKGHSGDGDVERVFWFQAVGSTSADQCHSKHRLRRRALHELLHGLLAQPAQHFIPRWQRFLMKQLSHGPTSS